MPITSMAIAGIVLAGSCAVPIIYGPGGVPQSAGGRSSATGASGAGTPSPSPSPSATRCEQPAGSDPFATSTPESVDIDADAVRSAIGDISMVTSASIRVYRHDCLVGTSGNDPENEATPNDMWSATKSVLSMLVGIAVTQGRLSLDDTIGRYLPQADPAHGALTLRQLMTQSSGLSFAWANDVAALAGDSVAYVLSLPFVHPPGTYFEYAQAPLEVVGAMVERAVGRDLQDFAQDELFGPLGIARSHWRWQRDGANHTLGFAGLRLAPIDMARLGSLLLHGGSWRGKQIISAAYVDAMATPAPTNGAYGLLTWTNRGTDLYTASALVRHHVEHRWIVSAPPDTFGMSGLFEQVVWVIPSLDIVVVRTGGAELAAGWNHAFMARLLGGLRDVHLPDPGPLPQDQDIDLSDFSRLIDLTTWPHP